MLKIGLTGGIGSGKTTVAKFFELLGIPVFNADEAAKRMMVENEYLKQELIECFGELVYDGKNINKKYLANIVFNNEYQLNKLNNIVHPYAIQAGLNWANQQTAPYVIKEAALMFEAGSAFNLDYVIGVFAPKHMRLHRAIKRDNSDRESIEARMQNQIDENIKMKLCDFTLLNNEQQLLIPQILSLHQLFLQIGFENNGVYPPPNKKLNTN